MEEEADAEIERVIIKPIDELDIKLGCDVSNMIFDVCTARLKFGLEEGFKKGYKFAIQLQKECGIEIDT